MDEWELHDALCGRYPMAFTSICLLRKSMSEVYMARAGADEYLLRIARDTAAARRAIDIQAFLSTAGLTPALIPTRDGAAFARLADGRLMSLVAYIPGGDSDAGRDAEDAGRLTARLHTAMRRYPGRLPAHGREYYIDRYTGILRARRYPGADEFAALGDAIWARVGGLPRGYCHGDLYDGNMLRAADGRMYALDFDTSATGFPAYDAALYCNRTDYFRYDAAGLARTGQLLERFACAYRELAPLSAAELCACPALIALYHFALQANIIEAHGPGCVDDAFFDGQLDWLRRFRAQCGDW